MALTSMKILINMAHLQYHPRWYHTKATLQVWWIYWINLLSYLVNKDDGNRQTGRWTDRQTQVMTITLRPKRSRVKNESRNAKRGWLIKWSIMRIFNEAEPPQSNSSEIFGQSMSLLSLKMICEKLRTLRVLKVLVCPAAHLATRPLGRRPYPGALKGCGVKL